MIATVAMVAIDDFRAFAVALAIGLVLGFEREHHEWREHEQSTTAGTRTFAVVTVAGAIAASLDPVVVAAGVLAVSVLVAVGYMRSATEHIGLTTEAATLAAFLLGALVWHHETLAVGIASVLTLVLVSKQGVRRMVREVVTEAEVTDAVRWFVLAFVVLPMMPNKGYGPSASINPARIWTLVLLLTGVGWFGYIATRIVGDRRGLLVVGATGGFVSGAATTLGLARIARSDPALRMSALGGSLLASVATCVQLAVLTWVAVPRFGLTLLPPMAVGSLLLAATALLVDRRSPKLETGNPELSGRRPLALKGSLMAAAVLGTTIAVSRILVDQLGNSVVLAVSAASGLADAHAASLSAAALVRDNVISGKSGTWFVGVALAANTVTKLVAATAAGGRWFGARYALGIAPAVVGVGATMWLMNR